MSDLNIWRRKNLLPCCHEYQTAIPEEVIFARTFDFVQQKILWKVMKQERLQFEDKWTELFAAGDHCNSYSKKILEHVLIFFLTVRKSRRAPNANAECNCKTKRVDHTKLEAIF